MAKNGIIKRFIRRIHNVPLEKERAESKVRAVRERQVKRVAQKKADILNKYGFDYYTLTVGNKKSSKYYTLRQVMDVAAYMIMNPKNAYSMATFKLIKLKVNGLSKFPGLTPNERGAFIEARRNGWITYTTRYDRNRKNKLLASVVKISAKGMTFKRNKVMAKKRALELKRKATARKKAALKAAATRRKNMMAKKRGKVKRR